MCGTTFDRKGTSAILCSPACKYDRSRKLHAEKLERYRAAAEPVERHCDVCGDVFIPHTGSMKRCSITCSAEAFVLYNRKRNLKKGN